MLRLAARPLSAAVACHATAAVRFAGGTFSQMVRHMSDETHDDFKPKVKVNVDDKDEVQKTIEKVCLRNMTCCAVTGVLISSALYSL